MHLKNSQIHLAAALAVTASFHFLFREITLKIADQVMVRADGAGLAELAAEHPWGVADWFIRLLAATNLTWWGFAVQLALFAGAAALAHFALKRRGSPFAPFAPWLAAALFVLPALSLGDQVWLLPRPHFPQILLVWFAILSGCLFAGVRGLLGFAALQIFLVALGRYGFSDLPAGETLKSAWTLPLQFEWDARSLCCLAPFAILVALAFAKRPAALPKWTHAAVPALFAIVFLIVLPHRDCRGQLKMERAVREERFADVLKVSPRKKTPERMESAWRILAMFRLDLLDRDLWRYPIIGTHQNTDEEEMIMEGPLYLFHYGLILPARRWTFETAAVKGWQPEYFRLLGDCALVTGEEALARKNFEELARCPFRGDFAERRLATLNTKPLPADAFADLSDVAGIYGVWCDFAKTPGAPVYFGNDRVVERFTYSLFLQLQSCPPPMLKMFFASALLDGRPEMIKDNPEAMQKLYPNGQIGPVFMEALK